MRTFGEDRMKKQWIQWGGNPVDEQSVVLMLGLACRLYHTTGWITFLRSTGLVLGHLPHLWQKEGGPLSCTQPRRRCFFSVAPTHTQHTHTHTRAHTHIYVHTSRSRIGTGRAHQMGRTERPKGRLKGKAGQTGVVGWLFGCNIITDP